MTDEVEQKLESTKVSKPSDAATEASNFTDRSKQSDWEVASEPIRTSQKISATHEIMSAREVADLQANGLAQKFEIVDLSDVPKNGSAEDTGIVVDYPQRKLSDGKTFSLGMDYEAVADTRSVYQKLGDFALAAGKRAGDPEGYKTYIQGELDKMVGVGEGLNIAKDQTKAAVVAGWNALTDGTVATFLAKPNAINDPLFHAVGGALTAMAEDPNTVNHALEKVGTTIINASERYSTLPNREKGHVIGETMFALVNPEGSTEGGKLTLQIAEGVATKIDTAVMKTISQSVKAAREAASPEIAAQTKQLLFDYLQNKGLLPQAEYAGIPKGYFDGIRPPEAAAKDNFLAMSKADDASEGISKRTTDGVSGSLDDIQFKIDKHTGRLQRTDLGKIREPYGWPVLNERFAADVVRQSRPDSCISAVGEMLSGGRLSERAIIDRIGAPSDIDKLIEVLGDGWTNEKGPTSLSELGTHGPFAVEMLEKTWTPHPKSPHVVMVEGPSPTGNVMICDPQEGTRYEMRVADFLQTWNGRCIYRRS